MTSSLTVNKNPAISYIRLLSTLMIIACHILQYFGNGLYTWFTVGVQVFFITSGFLYGGRKIEDPISFIYAQFKKILVPYWILVTLAFALHFVFGVQISLETFVRTYLCIGYSRGLEHLWFVPYILICYMLTPYINMLFDRIFVKNKKYFELKCFGIICLLFLIGFVFKGAELLPNRISCFALGVMIKYFVSSFDKKRQGTLCVFFTLSALVLCSVRIILEYKLGFSGPAMRMISAYAHMLLGAFIFFALYLALGKLKYRKYLSVCDKYSYYVYLAHQMFILGPLSLITHTGSVFVAILAIAVFTVLIERTTRFILGFCLKAR